ncbi:unnamed protein product [Ambrosiozyma monospora]|uniref:Unnamed protein product n=1 Tax=Ambrosiozyma monospora TaxID=43982 RepID=A0ACB5SVA2_AMBMO|nr:unnamed protein product [Ambrosiozyma monospora]
MARKATASTLTGDAPARRTRSHKKSPTPEPPAESTSEKISSTQSKTKTTTKSPKSPKKPKLHTKFDDDTIKEETDKKAPESMQPVEEQSTQDVKDDEQKQNNEPEHESESDDDAPEEESISAGKSAHLKVEQEKKAQEEESQRQLKEKRRQREAQLVEQKKQKELKIQQEKEQVQENDDDVDMDDEIPDTLPEDLLESYHNDQQEEQVKPKKIKFDEDGLSVEQQRNLKQAQVKKQLAEARSLTRNSANKGPVRVKVVKKTNTKLLQVPKSTIRSTKTKWLKRKSVKRQ